MRKPNESIYEYLKKKYSLPTYAHHKAPMSRRDLIKLGAIAGGAFAMPSLFPAHTWAATRPHIPFLCFDLAGGLGLPANFLVGQRGGPQELCDKYQQHGWNPLDGVDKSFGLPMSVQSSQILTGLKETLPEAILNQGTNRLFQMASMATFSLDDDGETPQSALTLISKAGLIGEKLKSGIGLKSSPSGGHTRPYLPDSSFRPKYLRGISEVETMTSIGSFFMNLPKSAKEEIFSQWSDHAVNYPELQAAYDDLANFGDSHTKGDPRKVESVRNIYTDMTNNSTEALRAAVVYNVLKGYSGPGVITIEDCDYHDGSSTTGDAKDLEFGRELGRAVALAHALETPLFIHIITDGGVYANSESYDRKWLGDASLHALSIMGFYDPTGKTEQLKLQLGHYTREGEVSLSNNNPVANEAGMIKAVLSNYLALNGLEGNIQELTGMRIQPATIDELRVFG